MKQYELINETLKRVNGKWALVSKTNPDKVLQYYQGPGDKKPSDEWVNNVERRIHSFEVQQDPCWDDYRQLGTKKKNGKTVPNCVPENISVTGTELAQSARKKNLVPGTDAWFKHWFGLPYMRREDFEYAKTELINYITEAKKRSCKKQ